MIKKPLLTAVLIGSLISWSPASAGNMARSAIATGVQVAGAATATAIAAGKFGKMCDPLVRQIFCVMAVVSVTQVVAHLITMGQNQDTIDATTCDGTDCRTDVGTGGDGSRPNDIGFASQDYTGQGAEDSGGRGLTSGGMAQLQKEMTQAQTDLAEKGYSFDDQTGGVNTPKGQIPASAFASYGGLAEAGFSQGDISTVKKILSQAERQAALKMNQLNAMGTSGGARRPAKAYGDNDDLENKFPGYGQNKQKRGVAGLQTFLGNDPIGVAGDNLFEMISRRYDSEERKGIFRAPDPVRTFPSRRPASSN